MRTLFRISSTKVFRTSIQGHSFQTAHTTYPLYLDCGIGSRADQQKLLVYLSCDPLCFSRTDVVWNDGICATTRSVAVVCIMPHLWHCRTARKRPRPGHPIVPLLVVMMVTMGTMIRYTDALVCLRSSSRRWTALSMSVTGTELRLRKGRQKAQQQQAEAESPSSDGKNVVLETLYACAVNLDDLSVPFLTSIKSESTFVEYTDDGLAMPDQGIGKFKEELANILAEPIVEITVSASVIFNSLLVAISTIPSIPYENAIRMAINVVGVIFAADFFARWFSSSKDTGKHVLNPQFAIDVVVVILPLVFGVAPESFWATVTWIPNWLTSPSVLINLELLRVLRLRRALRDKATFAMYAQAVGVPGQNIKPWQLQLARVLLSLFTLLSISTGLIYTVEHQVNPDISDYFTALYFGLTTLTTVGFGGRFSLSHCCSGQRRVLNI